MRPLMFLLISLSLLGGCTVGGGSDDDDSAVADDDDGGNPEFAFATTLGTFEVEIYMDNSPITAQNFVGYATSGFYDGGDGEGATIFHRVIEGFMTQGGGMLPSGQLKGAGPPIVNEAIDNGLSNARGTLAMARTSAPDSATSGFFVNFVDNGFLDPGGNSVEGYAVFGEVTDGMNVIDAMGQMATGAGDRPVTDIVVLSVTEL